MKEDNVDLSSNSIRLLGPVMVQMAGKRIPGFRSHKTIALLAFLIVENRPFSRDFLATLLWPDAPLAQARGHLRRSLYDLTHKLPGRINLEPNIVAFNSIYQYETDLFRLAQLATASDTTALEEVSDLCCGEFLEGLTLRDCPTFEDWLMTERERWRRKEVESLNRLLDIYVRDGRFDKALDLAWRLLRLQPWREDQYRRLMILLVRNGDPAMALKIFNRCRRVLADEFGTEPSDETTRLRDRIKKLQKKTPPGIVHKPSPLIGRGQELAQVLRSIYDPDIRMITITGPGGIGKSCLAINAGSRVNGPDGYFYLDGVFHVRLESVNTIGDFITVLSRSLRLTSAGKPVTKELILRYLRDKEMLLILDDYDLPPEDRAILVALLEEAPGISLLITSLSRLQLVGEWTIPLKGLSLEASEGGRSQSDAMKFFLNCLAHYRPNELSTEELETLQQICRLVEGMPLAIELAAGWIQTTHPHHALAELERNIDLLSSKENRPARQASLRAALDFTWTHLETDERGTLLRLSGFNGEFTSEEAKEVAHVSIPQLHVLVDRSLVGQFLNPEPGPESVCYYVHPLIRNYVRAKTATNQNETTPTEKEILLPQFTNGSSLIGRQT
jgi:DNA-binding SARP family transcriptional activator